MNSGEIRGREWGSEDGVPWIGNIFILDSKDDNIDGVLFLDKKVYFKSYSVTTLFSFYDQPCTGGSTMLELLSH